MRKQFGDSYYAHDEYDPAFTSKIEQDGGYVDSDDDGEVGGAGYEDTHGEEYEGGHEGGYEGEDGYDNAGDYDGDQGYEEEVAEGGEEEVEAELSSSKKKDKKKAKDELFDSLYKLDFEDIVAGIPCRFKYRQVPPEDFGLTAEDILNADDQELNQYVSLKKFATYRNKTDKDKDASKLSKKRKRLREAIKERLAALEKAEEEKKSAGKKGTKTVAKEVADSDSGDDAAAANESTSGQKKRKRKRNKNRDGEVKLINKFTAADSERGQVASSSSGEPKPKKIKKDEASDKIASDASEKKRRMGLYA
jgi:protein KRI1